MIRRRLGLSGGTKFVLAIAGLLIAWQFLNLPEMIDAFLTFCLAGVVPGTDIVLSPEAAMRAAGITIGAIAVLVTLRPVLRSLLDKKLRNSLPEAGVAQPESEAQVATADGIAEYPAEPVITPAQAFREHIFVSETAAPAAVQEVIVSSAGTIWLSRLAAKVYDALEVVMPRMLAALVKAAVLTQPKLKQAQREITRVSVVIWQRALKDFWWGVAKAKAFLHWLAPYLWQLDGWLEVKYRVLEGHVRHRVVQHETVNMVADVSRHTKKTITEMGVQTKVKKATTKAKPYAKKAKATAKKAHTKAKVKAKKVASKARSRKP